MRSGDVCSRWIAESVARVQINYYISFLKVGHNMSRFLVLLLLLSAGTVWSQKVTISNETSMRTDYAYDILGQIDDRILLYRDRGNEKIVEVFDEDLKFLYDRELLFPERRATVYGVAKQDSSFTIFTGFTRKGKYSLIANRYNKNVQPVDTSYVIEEEEDFKAGGFRFVTSHDRSKTLLFSSREGKFLYLYVIDNNTLELMWWKEILLKDFDVRQDFRQIFVTENGEVNVLFHDDEAEKGTPQFMLVGASADEVVYVNKLQVDKKHIIDITCKYDYNNYGLVIAGLASDDDRNDADSYFYMSRPLSTLKAINTITYRNFDAQFIEEVYGKKLGKRKQLKDFVTRDVIVRNDGGMILVTEMKKEFYRRSSFNNMSVAGGDGFGRGWVDIYTEDIVLVAVNPDGTEEWKKILYKKQFSQDDGGAFSSFFIFKTPSRMRLIYNDEVKANSTVSEYVLDPLGRYERNSLLSTEYQNLKIRWRNGIQVSPGVMLAPSEINNKLSVVKVDYNVRS